MEGKTSVALIPLAIAAAMVWQTASIKIVTTEQQEFIAKELLKIFSPNDTKVKTKCLVR